MTTKEAFEAWFKDRFKGALDFDPEADDGNAVAAISRIVGIEAWEEARKQALEDAAVKCDEWALQLTAYDAGKCATAETCAGLVRELKEAA